MDDEKEIIEFFRKYELYDFSEVKDHFNIRPYLIKEFQNIKKYLIENYYNTTTLSDIEVLFDEINNLIIRNFTNR